MSYSHRNRHREKLILFLLNTGNYTMKLFFCYCVETDIMWSTHVKRYLREILGAQRYSDILWRPSVLDTAMKRFSHSVGWATSFFVIRLGYAAKVDLNVGWSFVLSIQTRLLEEPVLKDNPLTCGCHCDLANRFFDLEMKCSVWSYSSSHWMGNSGVELRRTEGKFQSPYTTCVC